MKGEVTRLVINVPPRYGKTELLINFVAWALAQYPDSNFLYVSYSLGLAKKQTKTIRQIVAMNEYRDIFGFGLSGDTSAQGNFETTLGGSVYAAGADGEITGRGAGIKGVNRFGGCIVIDDIHKPSEVNSDTIRQSVNDWYFNTLQSRLNDPDRTPIIFIGQRLHEDDLAANLINSGDWETVIIPAMDQAGNPLHPTMHSKERLEKMQETMPYVYSSQYQQDPLPAGGGIFKPDWFYLTEEEPDIMTTFITADTAETDKSYNDATVFSFWGIYKIKHGEFDTGLTGLHWLDCIELRIEPKDLENEFMAFYTSCQRYKVRPRMVAIERKSTGVTLLSSLKNIRGLQVQDVERTKSSGNKTTRFLEIQSIVAARQISLPKDGNHTQKVLDHMRKITANDSHRHDDICLVGDSLVATLYGNKKIKDIKTGEYVITPFGLRKVLASEKTGRSITIKKLGLEGTHAHPVFYQDRFERLDTLNDLNKIDELSLIGLLTWTYKKLLSSMVLHIDSWDRNAIISANQFQGKVLRVYMSLFGSFIADWKYPKALLFIIKIIILSITTLAIWSVYRGGNILKAMQKNVKEGHVLKKSWIILQSFGRKLKNGIEVMKDALGIVKMPKLQVAKLSMLENSYVLSVSSDLQLESQIQNTAGIRVERESTEEEKDVYNITVDGVGAYYANGVLTSNCDTLYDAIKLGIIDNIVLSCSPAKIQEDEKVARTVMGSFQRLIQLRSQRS